jgi:hypothetical protein
MVRAMLLACVMLLAAGCSSAAPEANEPPTAKIVTISPTEAAPGETVSFRGSGTDDDGEVVAYVWRSDVEGELSRESTFETDSLSAGAHAIELKVQDNNGAWSQPARQTIIVRAPQVEKPQIRSFVASVPSIRAGQRVTLSWLVSGAESVAIDQGVGTVPPMGSVEVAPAATTTYRLMATVRGAVETASVSVTVKPVQVLVLAPDPALSGYVRFSGYAPYGEIYVGDDEADRGIRGFLTYRILDIPAEAVITRVVADLSGYEAQYDDPFPGMGCLSAFEHQYNTLQGQYRMPGIAGVVHQWCALAELDAPVESAGLRDLLQARLGEDRVQLRLQFVDKETDADHTRDILRWRDPNLPILTIEYYTGGG